jgi:hypothetical protein
VVVFNLFDTESQGYADDIETFLRSIGYTPISTDQRAHMAALGNKGLGMLVRDPVHPPSIASALYKAFNDAGVAIKPYLKEDMQPPEMIWISTGSKF